MARFYVGQRVRCAHSETGKFQGCEGTVIDVNHSAITNCGVVFENGLLVDHGSDRLVIGEPWRWEPINPEGAVGSEYSYIELMDRLRSGVAA